jgi:hypothetical protein
MGGLDGKVAIITGGISGELRNTFDMHTRREALITHSCRKPSPASAHSGSVWATGSMAK